MYEQENNNGRGSHGSKDRIHKKNYQGHEY